MIANFDVSTRRRVKLYMLNDERQWDEKGTGHVSATFNGLSSLALVVISETDGSHLLDSEILPNTAYQKQQETLIVWSDGDQMDFALSFQEKIGCEDIWAKICNVQGKDPSVDVTQDIIEDSDESEDMEVFDMELLPPCDLSHVIEISERFTQVINYPQQRQRLASSLEQTQYLKPLTVLFHEAESLEDSKSLHYFYDIARAMLQFNCRSLLDLIFAEDYLMDIIGMLEYTPLKRVKHREFLLKKAHFRELLPLAENVKEKIHQCFRVQYIQNTCLPSPTLHTLIDENKSDALTEFIRLKKIDIVTCLDADPTFISNLCVNLNRIDISLEFRFDLLSLLSDYALLVNSQTPKQKEPIFAHLARCGALQSLFYSLELSHSSLTPICVNILQFFVENEASEVRELFLDDWLEHGHESLHLNSLIHQLIHNRDPIRILIIEMLRVLFDPENTNITIISESLKWKEEFLNCLYRYSMPRLIGPLLEYTETGDCVTDDSHSASIIYDIMELLTFSLEYHSHHVTNYLTQHNIIVRIVILFKSRDKSLVLAALGVVRKFVASRDEISYRYIITNNILGNVVSLLDRNRHNNMLNSAILDLFNFIKVENIVCLIAYVVENHWPVLIDHGYSNIFSSLKMSYDASVERSARRVVSASNKAKDNLFDNESWYEQENEEGELTPRPSDLSTHSSHESIYLSHSIDINESSSISIDTETAVIDLTSLPSNLVDYSFSDDGEGDNVGGGCDNNMKSVITSNNTEHTE